MFKGKFQRSDVTIAKKKEFPYLVRSNS